ncbi:MAG: S-layer homology domain-containing protein, partial [Clostridia bacterium]|nr:S-layer homology domain-containing protein [Clostridia bacterium]
YCVENGIITSSQFNDVNVNITRGDMAIVFANILPEGEYTAVRDGSNPDVTSGMACYNAVAKLFKAGIVGGDSGTGNYRPNDSIKRSEACVIFTRIAMASQRIK